MFIKVEALFEIKEGRLMVGENPLQYLTKRIDETVTNDVIKTVVIEAVIPHERSLIIGKR